MAGSLSRTPKKRPRYMRTVKSRIGRLVRQPIFWLITAFGNGFVLLGAGAFHAAEWGRNPALGGFLDSLYWAVSTVTTVGYGSVVPITPGGKIVGIAMMMLGALFMWSYMALFVGAVISPDLEHLEREVEELESDLSEIQTLAHRRKD